MILPEQDTFHDVKTEEPITRRPVFQFVCRHRRVTKFTHVDHWMNPPPYADVYKGTVCRGCGKVIEHRKVY